MKPLVSIVIPVFNGEKFVSNCVESIIRQTIKELQIIVVDDGSQDRTLEILRKLAFEDKRIEVIHQKNGGVSKARNVGLQAVQAEWVLFVDADDTIAPDYCALMLEAANILKADVVIARPFDERQPNSYILLEKEKLIQSCLSYDEVSYPFNIDAPWGKLFRYSVICEQHICFPEKLTRSEDAFFCLQFYEVANKIGILNQFEYVHVERDGSLCHSFNMNAPQTLENILNENYQWVMEYHPREMKYMRALWHRVLPGIVECEKSFFLHPNFSGSLVHIYQNALRQKMICRAIHSLKLEDVSSHQYRIRLLLYKLHLGWLFIIIKKKSNKKLDN